MKLENLVPSLENCRKIKGNFEYSVFVWVKDKKYQPKVYERDVIGSWGISPLNEYIYPAPTLAEIMAELITAGVAIHGVVIGGNDEYSITTLPYDSQHTECDANPADAALRLWFRIENNKGE